MFLHGEQREVLSMCYEISPEPKKVHSKDVEELAYQGHELMMAGKAEQAETVFRKALEKEPDAPSLLFNLSNALLIQGRDKEGKDLIRNLHAKHPDYFFGRCGMARLAIEERRLEEAQKLLEPLLEQRKMHPSEFTALAIAQIELQLAGGEKQGARQWMEMWENIVPGHPSQAPLRRRIRGSVWDFLGGSGS
jgi:predicted Zn-dependent protease